MPSKSTNASGSPFNRRDFLKTTAAATAGAIISAEQIAAQTTTPAPAADFDLSEINLDALQRGLASGQFTSRQLVERYMARINAVDKAGPAVNSVIELNPDALSIADQLDQERSTKPVRGPLHGVPVLIKDNIATADRMQTTAGSLALVGSRPPRDAFLVQRLQAAGAVILGKTNLSEWANFRGEHSTSGWSARGGLTRNPYALDRNPSGSSSGSAVAVSANLCPIAVGTETDGSIVSPSSLSGIVGIKPTVGLVSRSGIIPISHTQDTAGPMARTVADAALLLGALAAPDPDDPATQSAQSHLQPEYTRFLDARGLRGARLGAVRKLAGFNREVDKLFAAALDLVKHAGAEVIDPVEIAAVGKLDEPEMEVLLFEFKDGLNRYLAALGPQSPVHTLADVIAFNEKNGARELEFFGQELMEKAVKKGDLSSADYQKRLAECRRLSRDEGIDAVMEKHRLDALVCPTDSPAWPTDFILGDHFLAGSSTLAAVAGYPHITLPMGFVSGLPVGVSFFGRAWSEPVLIRLAYAYEQATRVRRPPQFHPTAEPVQA
jgi:amidase